MSIFLSTLNRMGFLFLLIALGYLVVKLGALPGSASGLLSRLENCVLIPALMLGTFLQNFTVERIGGAWQYLAAGFAVALAGIPVAMLLARLCSRDSYVRNLYTYGLAFSNFGFMGNAVAAALFPELFMEYLIFVLPFWVLIYLWGVPTLLIPAGDEKQTLRARLHNFVNPMLIATLVGMVLGLSGLPIPSFVGEAITVLGDCMSPVAMLLTGMAVAKIDLKAAFRRGSVYAVSLLRLLAIPLAAVLLLALLPVERGLAACVVCALAMPLGLNTIVVPGAYGRDTSVASGMALISHLLSCLTIPAVFALFDWVMG